MNITDMVPHLINSDNMGISINPVIDALASFWFHIYSSGTDRNAESIPFPQGLSSSNTEAGDWGHH